jgi:hypothetical protein
MPTTSIFAMSSLCVEYISRCGYSVEDAVITPDLVREIEQMSGRHPVNSMLSPIENDFTQRNSFWLLLRKGTEIVGTLGARFDDIAGDCVGGHLARMHNRHYSKDGQLAVEPNLARRANNVSGGLVYMGDVFFAPGHRGDLAKTQCFCQYAFCLAFARWWERADWLIAMHREIDALAGKPIQHGFTSGNFPAAQNWFSPVENRSGKEYLSVLSKYDFQQNISEFIKHPDSLVAPPLRLK